MYSVQTSTFLCPVQTRTCMYSVQTSTFRVLYKLVHVYVLYRPEHACILYRLRSMYPVRTSAYIIFTCVLCRVLHVSYVVHTYIPIFIVTGMSADTQVRICTGS